MEDDDFELTPETMSILAGETQSSAPEQIGALAGLFQTVANEQAEANAVRQQADREIKQTSLDILALTEAQAAEQARSAATVAKLTGDTRSKLERIDEIQGSPLLKIVEPIAGFFNPRFSREALARDVQTDIEATRIESLRQDQNFRTTQLQRQALEQKAAVAQLNALQEAGDVDAANQALQTTRVAINDMSALRATLLADADNPDELVAKGIVTERAAKNQKQANANADVMARRQRIAAAMDEFRLEDELITRATEDQLLDPKFREQNGISESMAQQGLQKKANQALAVEQMRLAFRSQKVADTLAQTGDAEVKKLASGEKSDEFVSQQEAAEELARRQEKLTQTAASRANALSNYDRELSAGRKAWLASATTTQLEQALAEAGTSGQTQITDEATGFTFTIPLDMLQERAGIMRNAMAEEALVGSATKGALVGLGADLNQMQMVLNVPQPEDAPGSAPLIAGIESLIKSGGLTPEQAADLTDVAEQVRLVDEGHIANQRSALRIIESAQVKVNEVSKTIVNERLAGLPKAQEGAARRMIADRGVVRQQSDALLLSTPAVLSRTQIGSTPYDLALNSARRLVLDADSTVGTTESADPNAPLSMAQIRSLTQSQSQDRQEKLLDILTDDKKQAQFGAPIVSAISLEAFAQAAESMDSAELAQMIRSGAVFGPAGPDGTPAPINEGNLAQFILQNEERLGVKLGEFARAVTQVIPDVANRVTQPRATSLEGQGFVGAVNNLLFENDPASYAVRFLAGSFANTAGQVMARQFESQQRQAQQAPLIERVAQSRALGL